MFDKVIYSLIEILSEKGYTNLVVSNTIKKAKFTDYEKKLYTKLVYGVVENKMYLDYKIQPLTKGKRIKPFIKNAIRVGVYGLDDLNIPNHYLVNEIVSVVKKQDYKASTFVNALLRKYQTLPKRSLDNLSKIEYLSIKYSINKELVTLLYCQYQDRFISFFENNDEIFNTYLINTLKTSPLEIKQYLDLKNIEYNIENNMILQTKLSLIDSDIFKEGKIMAQDKSSIMVGSIVDPKKEDVILDACSAPGSKAIHLASIIENKGKIIAMDIYPHKLKLIKDNSIKMGATCIETIEGDATNIGFNCKFDRILLDVPCSGLGVMRHKPDLKYQMTLGKISSIKQTQRAILENIVQYLKPGGTLVYSTCTINKEENEEMMQQFLLNHSSFQIEKEVIVLPSSKEDGFYICKLRGF